VTDGFRSGFVTLLGRPNVGKSTLLNRIIGTKISITSRRPQTTRHRILGVKTTDTSQTVFVDTPGLHAKKGRAINQVINRTARASLEGVDVVVLLIEAGGWRESDELPLRLARQAQATLVLAINKIDRLPDKSRLLPLIEETARKAPFAEIIPISAQTGANVDHFLDVIQNHLPEGPPGFVADQITDRSPVFMCGEFVREQVFRQLGQELPYASAVEIEGFSETSDLARIEAVIWVDKHSHKKILVGRSGERIKQIGSRARVSLEQYLGKHVHLQLWVKVRTGWADSMKTLQTLGYVE